MSLKQRLATLLRLQDSNEFNLNTTSYDEFTLKFGNKLIAEMIFGFVLFYIAFALMDASSQTVLKNNIESSNVWVVTKLVLFISGLFYFVISSIFGTRKPDGKYVFKYKYIWIKPILYILITLLFTSLGFMLGAVFKIASVL